MTGPSAIVDLSRGGKQRQILRGEQAYDISVWLTVPTSSTNVGLGNFMIKVQLQNRNGQALITSSRPAIVTFESFLLRISRTVWRAIPLLLKWTREAQTLRVSLMENFVEDTSNPVSQVIIEISNPHLQIYKASLHINARFQGLRYFMYYYRISTAVVFISIFIFWELVFCVLTWQFLTSWFELEPSTVADTATASSLIATQGNRFDTHHWSRDRIMDRGTPSQILQRQHHSHTLDRPWIQTFLPWTRTETQHRPPQQQLQDGRSRLLASSSLLTADSDDNDDFDDDDDDHDDHVEEDSDDTGKGAVLAALTASEHHAALSSARLRRTTRVSSDTDRT
ncbi:Berardinelli-Seip congenital lipodystrophy 2 (seipin) [Mortierella claussenii]|nr:Berardinelli-Seip congenital lipodystrophy 2 (seipin) [Mortierella claussenii]